LLPAGAVAGWGSHPLESAALSRRTPQSDFFSIFYRTAMSALWRNFPPTFSASAGLRCCAVRDRTPISRVFRVMASLLSTAELVVSGARSIDTRTDIQQANGFLLAQESVACDGCR
jgi:hypothetical protein